ncbi:chromosome condensation protein CrcB [Paenibacillus selenitireducens]|uniref:Fluoride-specific ion channel FluC n=1 Tax=Paenibacillus selenitireducens TaxID=1324314 RepID=A0A1T2XKS5_9BACL|nr:fluoride efflux transporter CrcB [Paenibacillus selenitireducens]OPA80408.1 chromosome condensation protein CrcB [Paenibacillus selenitireducens]
MVWWIGLGGICGSILRFLLGTWISLRSTSKFPYGTFVINISGSLILGCIAGLHEQREISSMLYALLGIGFCGAYTTFSTFGVETIRLLEQRLWNKAAAYVLCSVSISIAGAWLGMWLTIR